MIHLHPANKPMLTEPTPDKNFNKSRTRLEKEFNVIKEVTGVAPAVV